MLIGVFSDTHDNIDRINQAIEVFNERRVSLVVHAGDITSPFALIPIFDKLKAEFVGIFGNNDGDRVLLHKRSEGRIHPQPHIFEVQGKKIVLIHEHHLVEALAASGHYDIVIYGHTHKARVEKKNGVLILNPGEAGHWLYGKATVALLDPEKMQAEIIPLP